MNNIKNRRIQKGYTLEALAKKVGVSTATVQRWETGKIKDMKVANAFNLAKELNISVPEIIGTAEKKPWRILAEE